MKKTRKLLPKEQVLERIKERAMEEGLTLNQEIDAQNIFYRAMNEELNVNKTLKQQISLIDVICTELGQKDEKGNPSTSEFVFRMHSDNKHMSYFDYFLQEGESGKILDILAEHKIPTDVLKGVHKNQNFDASYPNGVNVKQEVESISGDSPVIVGFTISLNGKVIYEWTKRDDLPISNKTIEALNAQGIDVFVEEKKREENKDRKSNYKVTYLTEDGNTIREYRYTDRYGHKRVMYISGNRIVSKGEIGL